MSAALRVRKRSLPRGPSAAELLQTLLTGENINALFAATTLAHAHLQGQFRPQPVEGANDQISECQGCGAFTYENESCPVCAGKERVQ